MIQRHSIRISLIVVSSTLEKNMTSWFNWVCSAQTIEVFSGKETLDDTWL